MLLTYNSDQFLLPDDPDRVLPPNIDEAVAVVSSLEFTKDLWEKVKTRVGELVVNTKASLFAAALELSCSTLNPPDKAVRCHVHVALLGNIALKYRTLDDLLLCDAHPIVAQRLCGRAVRSRTDHCCLYYVTCPKTGGIYKFTNATPHSDYVVAPTWIWNWLAMNKLSYAKARQEIVAQGKDLVRQLPNLDALEAERKRVRTNAMIAEREIELATVRRPWKPNCVVDAWLSEMSKLESRRRFLVLSGDSRVGKSEYALSLVPRGQALRLNCMNVKFPPLREYDDEVHKLIVFDEASVSLVLDNRLLFQAPNDHVQVGTSPTNRDVYSVYLHYCHCVVTSNTWKRQMEILKKENYEDWHWLNKNSVHYECEEKLYEDDEPLAAPSTPTANPESP